MYPKNDVNTKILYGKTPVDIAFIKGLRKVMKILCVPQKLRSMQKSFMGILQ